VTLLRRLRSGKAGAVVPAGDVWLAVGLGNPGPEYAATRHNVGYRVADLLAQRTGGAFRLHRSRHADVVEGRLGPPGTTSPRVVVARPRTYMNDSGGAVRALLDFYRVPPERLVVVHDELDLPLGALRVKLGGGDNGHNGLKSLRAALGTGEFHRVRVGIGRPPGSQAPADFVLRPFAAGERPAIDTAVARAVDAVESLLIRGLSLTQSDYN
jgi:PTH1 family peptidyl-tRNA hydrolase